MKYDGIKCVVYSLGYGIYLVDLISEIRLGTIADHMKECGLDVIEIISNPKNKDQAFVVTRCGRPPCVPEKNQITSLVLSGLDIATQEHTCYHLPKRLIMLKQELGFKVNIIQ